MAFEELYLVSSRVAPLDGAVVDALLAESEIDPPGGYREFLTRFGLGEVCGFLSMRSPEDVRQWRVEVGAVMLDEQLYDIAGQEWAAHGVTFEQYRNGVELWSTNQRPSYLAVPGHGPRVFEFDVHEVVCHERGMIDMIPAVARLMFNTSFPYFEPRRLDREWDSLDPKPEVEIESFVAAVFKRWGDGVRRLHSDQDDYIVTVFARQIQARFACWHAKERDPSKLSHVQVTYDIEYADELHDFLKPLLADLSR